MAKTLPELFDEVKARHDDFCDDTGLWWNASRRQWWVCAKLVSDALAETIIIGACVAMLPNHWWGTNADGTIYVCEDHHYVVESAPTLAAALLLAVLAQAERSGT